MDSLQSSVQSLTFWLIETDLWILCLKAWNFPILKIFVTFLREFDLNFEKDIHRQIIEFQALDMRYQKPNVIERTDIGFPQGLGWVSN